jgi:hypothetical protein
MPGLTSGRAADGRAGAESLGGQDGEVKHSATHGAAAAPKRRPPGVAGRTRQAAEDGLTLRDSSLPVPRLPGSWAGRGRRAALSSVTRARLSRPLIEQAYLVTLTPRGRDCRGPQIVAEVSPPRKNRPINL